MEKRFTMSEMTLQTAGLQDIAADHVKELLADLQARNSAVCDLEYGVNRDSGQLVFHFFPPGYALDSRKDWPDWTAFRDKLEDVVLATFSRDDLDAGYVQELKSFYVQVNHPGVPDLNAFLAKFFEALES